MWKKIALGILAVGILCIAIGFVAITTQTSFNTPRNLTLTGDDGGSGKPFRLIGDEGGPGKPFNWTI